MPTKNKLHSNPNPSKNQIYSSPSQSLATTTTPNSNLCRQFPCRGPAQVSLYLCSSLSLAPGSRHYRKRLQTLVPSSDRLLVREKGGAWRKSMKSRPVTSLWPWVVLPPPSGALWVNATSSIYLLIPPPLFVRSFHSFLPLFLEILFFFYIYRLVYLEGMPKGSSRMF